MPKLKKAMAKQVDKAEAASGSYLLDEGRYAARLQKVEERTAQSSGNEYWAWVLGDIHDSEGAKRPGRLWHNTSLSERALGFLKATFEAFGYTADSDTDEMIGEWVTVYVIQEPIARGPKAGQLTNRVQTLSEFEADEWDFDPEDLPALNGAGGSDDEY